MTTAETHYNNHHPARTVTILALALGTVAGAGQVSTGGVEVVVAKAQKVYDTAFGMKNVELVASDKPNMTSAIGTAAFGCIDEGEFGVNRVRKVHDNPETFLVSVRQIGDRALDAASVDACITKQTGANVEVVAR